MWRRLLSTSSAGLMALLRKRIESSGPLSVSQYINHVLTDSTSGYYMTKDVFGAGGDFITSPEISQVFGELLGVWCVNEWQEAGSPDHVQLVELGPGRGTLTQDMLRVFGQFPQLTERVSVHLVELSPAMRRLQCQRLTGTESAQDASATPCMTAATARGVPVSWYTRLNHVPRKFSCFIAHEFLDALPIHKFQRTAHGWREVLVDVDPRSDDLTFVLSPGPTPASQTLLNHLSPSDFRDHVEVSPESALIVKEICERIGSEGGMTLIADYGHSGEKGDTFRAFKQHDLHDPLMDPGTADLTADVDFSYLKSHLTGGVAAHGPITQSDFLHNMGIGLRVKMLYEKASPQQRKDLLSAYSMLTDRELMGERFKFMSILSGDRPGYVPAGFKACE